MLKATPTSMSGASSGSTSSSIESVPGPDRSRAHSKAPDQKEQRVPLACLRCRSKRARCSGNRPRCTTCKNADAECTWPEGRRRKRTRREMEEAERLEREAAAMAARIERRQSLARPTPQQELPQPLHHDSLGTPVWNPGDAAQQASTSSPPLSMPLDKGWGYPSIPPNHSPYLWPSHSPSSSSKVSGFGQPMGDYASELLANAGMSMSSSAQATQLMRALQSQTAFVEGDPSMNEDLELYYYRISGSTAFNPGINRISLKLQPKTVNGPPVAASAPVPSEKKVPPSPTRPEELFDQNNMPFPRVYIPLLDTFFRTMSQHFPSISCRRMNERLETGTMSAFLLNCICAISARFHPGNERPAEACAPFITKAQELIVPLIHIPAHDSVTGLLLLAWACYGQNSDAALWQYSGMAFRMSFDLGLHEISEIYETSAHVVRTRLLFWSLFITDRILSFSTGRPSFIPEDIIEIPLPMDEDFFPDPARNIDPASLREPVEPIPFQYLVRLFVLCGRIATVLNGRRDRSLTLVGPNDTSPHVLSTLQTQLVKFYTELSDSMKWSVTNFKHQEGRGHGGTFLTLHLWANAVMAFVYHPQLTMSPSGTETPFSQAMQRSIRLAFSSSRNVSECLEFADLFSSQSYLGSPFCVHPIYVACSAFIAEIKRGSPGNRSPVGSGQLSLKTEEPPTADAFLTSIARQSLCILLKATQRMESFWAGISYVLNLLEERSKGLGYGRIDSTPRSTTFISLPDKGLLQRYLDKDLPHNTAPATDTSLRTSIEKDAAAANSFYVEDLLSSYNIQGLLVQPADNYDMERLLTAGSRPDNTAGMAAHMR
ncbi:hypothetical protein M0805_005228 [Coniferiporia weirii]|nr:hypothetical protein M0805_005228 [Coniferiporia weirii]